jgi:outer membrane protein assembly factor BamE
MLNDVFHTNRWDYVYYDKPRIGKETRRHIAVHFEDGRVSEVTRDFLPEAVA